MKSVENLKLDNFEDNKVKGLNNEVLILMFKFDNNL